MKGSRSQKLSRMILPTSRSYSTQLDVGVRAEETDVRGIGAEAEGVIQGLPWDGEIPEAPEAPDDA